MCTKHHACRSKSLTQPMHSHQTSCDGSPKIVAIRAAGVSASCDGDSCCTSDGGGGATLERPRATSRTTFITLSAELVYRRNGLSFLRTKIEKPLSSWVMSLKCR